MALPRPPPHLMPELIEEILIRIPPDVPPCLVRASLVCKPWRRVLCDPAFRRRYVAFHGSPPLLGFLQNRDGRGPRFVSTAKPSPLPLHPFGSSYSGWSVLDCRHGRVLLLTKPSMNLVVRDLATTVKPKRLPQPPFSYQSQIAAVLCAVRGCDHLDCHGGPFLVVLVAYVYDTRIATTVLWSCLYSSEASTWSSSAYQGLGFIPVCKPSVLIGDDIYSVVHDFPWVAILKVDLGKNHLSIINRPEGWDSFEGHSRLCLMAMQDGSLGFAGIQQGSRLCLWSRNVNMEDAGVWVQCRFIELQTLIPFTNTLLVVAGSAEGSGIIFVATYFGVFSLDLKSSHVFKLDEDEPPYDFPVFPLMTFYTPGGSSSNKL